MNDMNKENSLTKGSTEWITYDNFEGPELDTTLWGPLTFGPKVCVEPEAKTTVKDGVLTLDIPRFTNCDPKIQGADNSKHVILSKQGFKLPAEGTASFSVDLRAQITGDESGDYRQGLAAFIVIDKTCGTNMLFDILSMGDRYLAEHEVLPMPGQQNPYTRMIEDPLFFSRSGQRPDPEYRRCQIDIDRLHGQVTWKIDGQIYFSAAGLTGLPEEVYIGYGIFTVVPLENGKGSCHGQGIKASWRNFAYNIAS
jgi:hypothetical protein